MDLAAHYADTRPVEEYADKRIFIVGKQNSGFELATGMLPWAKRIIIASPSPAKLSVNTHSLVGIRARYVQPYEDHVLGGGVAVLDAAIEGIERGGTDAAFRVVTRRSSDSVEMSFEVDEVIAATGFTAPLLDLPELGVTTFGQSRLPAQTPFWESATVPGIFFAGTIGQGSGGLKKHGIPSNSGAVQGARYNARVLARHIATTRFGVVPDRPLLNPSSVAGRLIDELTDGPELWHQRAYLARVAEHRSGRGNPRRGHRAAGLVRRCDRSGFDRRDARDRRDRRGLPGDLPAQGWGDLGAYDRSRSAPQLSDGFGPGRARVDPRARDRLDVCG